MYKGACDSLRRIQFKLEVKYQERMGTYGKQCFELAHELRIAAFRDGHALTSTDLLTRLQTSPGK